MGIIIRAAKIEDLKSVQDLNHGLFIHDQKWISHLIMEWPYGEEGKTYFEDGILGRDGACFVAELDGAVIGYIRGAIVHSEGYRDVKQAELANMYIDDEYRRQGVGESLVGVFTRWCKEQGAERIFVEASSGNDRAITFYEKGGFEPASLRLEKDITA